MRELYVLAEGQTEEAFVGRVLAPHLQAFDLYPTPVLVATKRPAEGGKYGGGVTSWAQVEREVHQLLGASHAVTVTTMIDLYGLPDDWPGYHNRPSGPPAVAEHLEAAMAAAVRHPRFLPYLSLHEYEALLFAAPETVASVAGPDVSKRLAADVRAAGSPEAVNEGQQTSPSKRLQRYWPGYARLTDGPTIASRTGLQRLRSRCTHFGQWLTNLESL